MFTLPNLPYDYDALEPAISKDIMQLHHDKHHQTYVDKLNTALQDHPDLQGKTVEELLTGLSTLPESIQAAVRNHGGGHYNHSLFWLWMSPTGGGEPTGALGQACSAAAGSGYSQTSTLSLPPTRTPPFNRAWKHRCLAWTSGNTPIT
jgi:Fe-Mn family superoxide dismutase